jgi:DNA uptake protein ComE-like DNA-binding protein
MKLNSEPVRNWFGYTRRERRSSTILLAIIIIIIASRYILPQQNIDIENYGTFLAEDEGNSTETPEAPESPDPRVALSPVISGTSMQDSYVQKKTLLDINSCDSLDLVALPGIGPVLSARIIKYRNLLGGFARVEQLKEVYGLPEETYELIKEKVFADTSGLRKININSSGYRELSQIHYLEKYDISAILKYKSLTGRIKSIEDLKENKILTPEKAEKVEPYLDFR